MKQIIFCIGLLLVCFLGEAQEERLPKYNFKSLQAQLKEADVNITVPKGYEERPMVWSMIEMNPRNTGRMNRGSYGGWPFYATMQSKDGKCMFIYPQIFKEWTSAPAFITYEVNNFFGSEDVDVSKYVTVLTGAESKKMGNADVAVLYKTRSLAPFYGQYHYFMNIYLRKANHPFLMFKIAMTSESCMDVDKYIKELMAHIKYGDNVLEFFKKHPDSVSDGEFKFERGASSPTQEPYRFNSKDKEEFIKRVNTVGFDPFIEDCRIIQ